MKRLYANMKPRNGDFREYEEMWASIRYKIRVRITVGNKPEDGSAIVEVWSVSSLRWEEVHSLTWPEMQTPPNLYHLSDPRACFREDAEALMTMAVKVLRVVTTKFNW